MKKIKLNGKLNLNKETVSRLNDPQMHNFKGGAKETRGLKCNTDNGLSFGKLCTHEFFATCNSHAAACETDGKVTQGIFCG